MYTYTTSKFRLATFQALKGNEWGCAVGQGRNSNQQGPGAHPGTPFACHTRRLQRNPPGTSPPLAGRGGARAAAPPRPLAAAHRTRLSTAPGAPGGLRGPLTSPAPPQSLQSAHHRPHRRRTARLRCRAAPRALRPAARPTQPLRPACASAPASQPAPGSCGRARRAGLPGKCSPAGGAGQSWASGAWPGANPARRALLPDSRVTRSQNGSLFTWRSVDKGSTSLKLEQGRLGRGGNRKSNKN